MLASLETPFEWLGESVSYVTVSPRYKEDTLLSIQRGGGVVAVGRVRPGHNPLEWAQLEPSAMDYWGAGVLTVLAEA